MTGDKDNGDLDSRISQLTLKVQTVDTGKVHIQNKATRPFGSLVAQEFFGRLEGLRH